jgi:hypothetical protein
MLDINDVHAKLAILSVKHLLLSAMIRLMISASSTPRHLAVARDSATQSRSALLALCSWGSDALLVKEELP